MTTEFKYISEAVDAYNMYYKEIEGDTSGLDEGQVRGLEAWFGSPFAPAFKEYLSWAGNVRYFFSIFGIETIEEEQANFEYTYEDEQVEKSQNETVLELYDHPSKPLIIATNGETLFWIYPSAGDPDPTIFRYDEYGYRRGQPRDEEMPFSDFLYAHVWFEIQDEFLRGKFKSEWPPIPEKLLSNGWYDSVYAYHLTKPELMEELRREGNASGS